MREFLGDRKGAAAVEFAFVAPVFLLFVFFILDVGLGLFTQVVLDNAVASAARQIQIGSASASSAAGIRSLVCAKTLSLVPSCKSNLQVWAGSGATFGAITPPTLSSKGLSSQAFATGGTGAYVLLEVAYPRPFSVPVLEGVRSQLIVSAVAFESEPY